MKPPSVANDTGWTFFFFFFFNREVPVELILAAKWHRIIPF